MPQRVTLREREKRQRRWLIAQTALDLFDRRGFAGTTVDDIADAAGIAPRTFFLHFPSKDDVVFSFDEDRRSYLADRLARRSDSALAVAMDVFLGWLAERGEHTELIRQRLISECPSLAARSRLQLARYQELLTGALREDLSATDRDVRPDMAAAAALAGWEIIGRRHARGEVTVDQLPALLEEVAASVALMLRQSES